MALTKCPCGSDDHPWILMDARGIFCGYVCDHCEQEKRAQYRPDIFTDAQYPADEPIEPDDGEGEFGLDPPGGDW